MKVIDPLRKRISNVLEEGINSPLIDAREKFGTKRDILDLQNSITELTQEPSERNYFFIDLTPFRRIIGVKEIVNALDNFPEIRPVILLNQLVEDIEFIHFLENTKIVLVVFDLYGDIDSIKESSNFPSIKDQVKKDFPDPNTLNNNLITEMRDSNKNFSSRLVLFRRLITEQRLTNLLCQPGFLDLPGPNDLTHDNKYISGGFYKKMENEMLVSCYINIKKMGDYEILLNLSYEIVLHLFNCFTLSKSEEEDSDEIGFDYIITPSNSALFIASMVQLLTNIGIIAVDKLGPIPDLHQDTYHLLKQLSEKRVVIFQEVIATGSETDRTIMFLNQMNVTIIKIIALFNLEVGKVKLVNDNTFLSLCRPKEEIRYVYRSG